MNMAIFDATLTTFDTKYHHTFWRPYTAIREIDDGRSDTVMDPTWLPFLNTPPHPEYNSAQAVIGTAAAYPLDKVYGSISFTITSTTADPPGSTRSFSTFDKAPVESSASRIWGGIHFRFSIGSLATGQAGRWARSSTTTSSRIDADSGVADRAARYPAAAMARQTAESARPVAALFVTCIVDMFRPVVGFAAARLIERCGFAVEVPRQTCCGQPAYNSGDDRRAREVARGFLAAFSGYQHIVAPSGSCAGMVKTHMEELFSGEPDTQTQAREVARRTSELTAFVAEHGPDAIDARCERVATYHDSCSGLRELRVREQPRELLGKVAGLSLREYEGAQQCCGFGGTFCVKYSDISTKMCGTRCEEIERSGADLLLGGDLSCLLNLSGMLSRRGSDVEVRHVAEVLAGMDDQPAIGRAADDEP
jgi:L-lactate dehydrogenase complex protein LldE